MSSVINLNHDVKKTETHNMINNHTYQTKIYFILQLDICYHLVHLLLLLFSVRIGFSQLYSQILFENFNSRKLKQNKIQEKRRLCEIATGAVTLTVNTTISRKIRNLQSLQNASCTAQKGKNS